MLPSSMILRSLLIFIAAVLTSCQTSDSASRLLLDQRAAEIAAEPRGDYFIGRRCYIGPPRAVNATHFWGYVRRPGEPWDKAKLVILNEDKARAPDRLPESGPADLFGFDHNREYRFWGSFTDRRAYDPNSDMVLPVFALQRWQLINPNPGWLFHPKEKFNGQQLLRAEPRSSLME